jgi:hypothetical protein
MTNYPNPIARNAIALPITQAARRLADQFASQQPTPEKADQVRLNTLAVCVMNDYLQWMDIPTDLSAGDSWNPVVRLCADVADLQILGLGRLECRSLWAEADTTCAIPPEVWEDRIGYVVVQFHSALETADFLGFVETAAIEALPLDQLQPPEALLDHLDQLVQVAAIEPVSTPSSTPVLVNLSQWFQSAFTAGWQAVEAVFSPADPAFAFRTAPETTQDQTVTRISRAKPIELGLQSVVLLIELTREPEQATQILLQVHPTGDRRYLPPDLQLMILDETGMTFLSAQSRSTDNYLQLQFSGQPGEQFSVQLTLDTARTTEDFVI